jgi:predicted GTPase
VENSLWKRIWTCRKTDYRMNEWMNEWMNDLETSTMRQSRPEKIFYATEKKHKFIREVRLLTGHSNMNIYIYIWIPLTFEYTHTYINTYVRKYIHAYTCRR